jgi:hypothetical protein
MYRYSTRKWLTTEHTDMSSAVDRNSFDADPGPDPDHALSFTHARKSEFFKTFIHKPNSLRIYNTGYVPIPTVMRTLYGTRATFDGP